MKKLVWLLPITAALAGCVNPNRFAMSQTEQQRIMDEVVAKRRAIEESFPRYAGICLKEFPDATDPKNDGGQHMSEQGSINVAMWVAGRDIVCSVNTFTMQVERVFQANRIRSLDEYKEYVARNPLEVAAPEEVEPDPPANDPRLSYKGVRLGDSLARFKSKLPLYECRNGYCTYSKTSCESTYTKGPRGTSKECAEGTSYGGSIPSNGFVTFIDGKVASISLTLDSGQVSLLDNILIEKYGKPKSTDETPFMNKVGTQFPNTKRTWIVESETLTTTFRSGVVDEGNVDIRGKAAQQQSKEAAQKRVQRNKQDF